jgi:hypothetical protein
VAELASESCQLEPSTAVRVAVGDDQSVLLHLSEKHDHEPTAGVGFKPESCGNLVQQRRPTKILDDLDRFVIRHACHVGEIRARSRRSNRCGAPTSVRLVRRRPRLCGDRLAPKERQPPQRYDESHKHRDFHCSHLPSITGAESRRNKCRCRPTRPIGAHRQDGRDA